MNNIICIAGPTASGKTALAVALAKALGYSADIKQLLAEPQYSTMEELETINRNRNRKRGRQ